MAEEKKKDESKAAGGAANAAPPPAKSKSGLIKLVMFLVILLGTMVVAFLFLDERVKIGAKNLEQIWQDKQIELRSMARQRMYDSQQSHQQTEMMDRFRHVGRVGETTIPASTE